MQLNSKNEMISEKAGTPLTAAPEVFMGRHYGLEAEVFRYNIFDIKDILVKKH